MKPLVSVIIPIFRVEDYLDRCVQCVCEQTYRNLEIILVDDGSDDNCPAMCDEWSKKDNRIQVIHKKNGGLSDARNAGLKVASGEFVYFLDSDDYVKSETIEKALDVMLEKNVDVVVFGFQKVDESGKYISDSTFHVGEYNFSTEKEKLRFIYKYLLQMKVGWEVWSRLYRMDIIRKNNLKFEPNKEIFAEDRCFNLYYTLCSNSLYCMEDKFYYYLIRNNSIMGKQKEWKVNEAVQLSKKVFEKAKEKNMNYIMKNYHYIVICLLGILVFLMKPEEYKHYADKLIDKEYCKKSYNEFASHVVFRQIWGIRGGVDKRKKYKEFISYL